MMNAELMYPDGITKRVWSDSAKDGLTIGKELFTQAGVYTLTLTETSGEGEPIRIKLDVAQAVEFRTYPVPAHVIATQKDHFGYNVGFAFGPANNDEIKRWIRAINGVIVNGKNCRRFADYGGNVAEQHLWLGISKLPEDINDIVITAEGYDVLVMKVDGEGRVIED